MHVRYSQSDMSDFENMAPGHRRGPKCRDYERCSVAYWLRVAENATPAAEISLEEKHTNASDTASAQEVRSLVTFLVHHPCALDCSTNHLDAWVHSPSARHRSARYVTKWCVCVHEESTIGRVIVSPIPAWREGTLRPPGKGGTSCRSLWLRRSEGNRQHSRSRIGHDIRSSRSPTLTRVYQSGCSLGHCQADMDRGLFGRQTTCAQTGSGARAAARRPARPPGPAARPMIAGLTPRQCSARTEGLLA